MKEYEEEITEIEGEGKEDGLIKIVKRPTIFREDNIFPPWAKITHRERGDGNRNERRSGF